MMEQQIEAKEGQQGTYYKGKTGIIIRFKRIEDNKAIVTSTTTGNDINLPLNYKLTLCPDTKLPKDNIQKNKKTKSGITRASIIDPLLLANKSKEDIITEVLNQLPDDNRNKIKTAISTRIGTLRKKGYNI